EAVVGEVVLAHQHGRAAPRDADRDDVEGLAVDGAQYAGCGDAADAVLARTAAEQQHDGTSTGRVPGVERCHSAAPLKWSSNLRQRPGCATLRLSSGCGTSSSGARCGPRFFGGMRPSSTMRTCSTIGMAMPRSCAISRIGATEVMPSATCCIC